MNPEQILAALRKVYAECRSYRDRGQVATRFIHDGRCRDDIKPFTTAFVRPDRFRYEFRDRFADTMPWKRYVVWAGGGEVRTWWDVEPGVERPGSLRLGLSGAAGVSGGSAFTVPSMLVPDLSGRPFAAGLVGLASLGDADLGGVACYRLSGSQPVPEAAAEEDLDRECLRVTGRRRERSESSPLTLWIDRGTFLLRRVDEEVWFESFRTEETTTYEPEVDAEVPDDELLFDPPAVEA